MMASYESTQSTGSLTRCVCMVYFFFCNIQQNLVCLGMLKSMIVSWWHAPNSIRGKLHLQFSMIAFLKGSFFHKFLSSPHFMNGHKEVCILVVSWFTKSYSLSSIVIVMSLWFIWFSDRISGGWKLCIKLWSSLCCNKFHLFKATIVGLYNIKSSLFVSLDQTSNCNNTNPVMYHGSGTVSEKKECASKHTWP